MIIKNIERKDLKKIHCLQPENWRADIIPFFDYYLNSPFCRPIKVVADNTIVGLGSSINYGETAWLAHIIVHPGYRNRGIGYAIVQNLIEDLNNTRCTTILLIATKLGEPVYTKAGFVKDTDYVFFSMEENNFSAYNNAEIQDKSVFPVEIIPFEEKYKNCLLNFDRMMSGENREIFIAEHLRSSVLFVRDGKISGSYFPTLGNGLIFAEDKEAGIELMKYKHAVNPTDSAVLPEDNIAGIDFLTSNGFKEVNRGYRMYLGNKINWYPEKMYSRIGGHVG